jgi:hypothetical protein
LPDLRLPEYLDHTDERDQHRVLLEADEVVEQRRDYPAHRLWEHHMAQRLGLRQAERARCGSL